MSHPFAFGSRVIVKKQNEEDVQKGGVFIPSATVKSKYVRGKVLDVGPGEFQSGTHVPVRVREGQVVMFSPDVAAELFVDGESFFSVHATSIVAVF